MTAVKDGVFTDHTVVYNGVTFGGDGTDMMPPTYSLRGRPVYDDADREITHVQYVLSVQTVVYAATENELSNRVDELRQKLQTVGKKLELAGMGVGWSKRPKDLIWGAKPRSLDLAPVGGIIAWELIWTIEFNVSECTTNLSQVLWMAFNYDTAWDYDFEGQGTRIISGYIQILQHRVADLPLQVADAIRDNLHVDVPFGFKRERQVWKENSAKNRLDFSIVDRQLDYEAYPPNCTVASGSFEVSSTGIGFAQGRATLSMSITTKPTIHRQHASYVFFRAALAKQSAMIRDGAGEVTVIPNSFSARHQLFTRTSQFSIGWELAGCIHDLLTKKGIWEPLPDHDYNRWKTSIDSLWEPRGSALLQSARQDDVIVNLCRPTVEATIGRTPARTPSGIAVPWKWACPDIPEDASWLAYDLRLNVYREEVQTQHVKAVDYLPSKILPISWMTVQSLGAKYHAGSDEHEIEYNGYPTWKIVLQFKALRVQHEPEIPQIESVGGVPVVLTGGGGGGVHVMANLGCHELWYANVTQVYTATDYIPSMKPAENKLLCVGPADPEGKY